MFRSPPGTIRRVGFFTGRLMKPFEKDPFTLMTFHRVLIGTGTAMCVFYGGWELQRNYPTDPSGAILRAIIAWIIAIGLVIYLWRIRGKK